MSQLGALIGHDLNDLDGAVQGFVLVELLSRIPVVFSWVVPLTAAMKVRGKNFGRSHVISFLHSVDGPIACAGKIASLMKPFASVVECKTNLVFEANPGNNWIRYRLTASSTPGLFSKASAAVPSTYAAVVVQATRDLVQAARDHPTDPTYARAIPETAVGDLAAMLEGAGMYPAEWFAGERAKSSVSQLRYRMIKTAAKKELEISTTAMNDAMTLVQLRAALAALPAA
jgi:hypothetical protein